LLSNKCLNLIMLVVCISQLSIWTEFEFQELMAILALVADAKREKVDGSEMKNARLSLLHIQ
jgi:hypothetical protein